MEVIYVVTNSRCFLLQGGMGYDGHNRTTVMG